MKYPEPMSWDRAEARKGKFNGKFIIGVMTTGIYCLPSCAARPPKPQNVRLFTTEAEAKAAGLRACKRCRPDLYYKGEDENVALFEGLTARISAKLPSSSARASPPRIWMASGRSRRISAPWSETKRRRRR